MARAIARASLAAQRFARGEISLQDKEALEQAGIEARERMIRANLRLVVSIAKAFSKRGMPLSDLIEEGNLGLMRAVEGFDPDMGTRFGTYASWWIKQSIKRALINTVQPVHIPAYMVELIARWKQAHGELQESLGRSPSIQEIASQMEVSEKKVRIIRRAVRAVSAASQATGSEAGAALSDMLPDPKSAPPDEAVLDEAEAVMLSGLVETLSEREATILKLRYGMGQEQPLTLRQIGEKIGLTRERVRQLEAEALRKLQAALPEGR